MNAKNIFLVLIISLLSLVSVFGQEFLTVNVTNDTGYELQRIYISPSMSDDWHEDLLGGRSIVDGATLAVDVPVLEEDAQYYDVLAIDIDEDRYSRFEVDLSDPQQRDIVLTFDDFEEGEMETGGDDSYNQAYLDGYRDAWREAYKEAYGEGYRAGLEDAATIEALVKPEEVLTETTETLDKVSE